MNMTILASALGLLLLAGGCSHGGHYRGGRCDTYWGSSQTVSIQPETLAAGSFRTPNTAKAYTL